MKHTKKKKKRPSSRASKPTDNDPSRDNKQEDEEQTQKQKQKQSEVISSLMAAFESVSIEEATSAFNEANGEANKAAEILADLMDYSEDPSTRSSVSSSSSGLYSGSGSSSWGASSSGSSEGFAETGCVQNMLQGKGFKQKRLVAATGTVSTVLGKDYVKTSPRNSAKLKGFWNGNGNGSFDKDEAEQFLCSMLGDECDLSMAVVRDVLCQYGYNVEKTLDALLDLSASYNEQSWNGQYFNDTLTDRASDCTSHSSESDLQESIWSIGDGFSSRTYSKVLTNSEAPSPTSQRISESDIPQKVLESLFNISQSPEHEPSTMNWRNLVKKMQSLGPGVDVCPSSVAEPQPVTCDKGNEYLQFRKPARQHWDAMRSYYQKAAEAYSKGKREHAAYLSDQGKLQTRFAQEADEKASQVIFKARNKGIENVITIDLHGQHVKQAMRMLKQHLLLVSFVPSIQILRVITGCGSHGLGKSKLKQSVIKLLEKERIEWSEENRGTVLIKLDGYREFSFLDSESDTEE